MKKISLILFAPLLLISIWFQHGGMLAGAEEGLPFYSASKMWSLSSTLWLPIETGIFAIDLYPRMNLAWLFVVFSGLHMPTFLFQALLFYILMVTGMFSVYCLIKFFLKGRSSSDAIALLAALFYLLNPYSMTQVWQRGLYAQYFIFALLPLSLYLFAYGLEKKKLLYVCLIALSSFAFSTAFGLVTNIIVFWSVLFFYFCFWISQNTKFKQIIMGTGFFMLTFLGWTLINAWWFIPLILFKQDIFGGKAGDALGNIAVLNEVSRYFTFPATIRLLQDYYFFNPGIYGALYGYKRFQLISWILPLCIIIAVFALNKANKLLFFLILFCISFFFCLGSNPPLGEVFVKLFEHITLFQAFRNPYEKYGIVFMLAYTPLFAYGLYTGSGIIQRVLNRFVKIPTLLICLFFIIFTGGIYLWPMWQGLYKTAVRVPSEYKDVNNWLAEHEKDSSSGVFIIPFGSEGINTKWNFSGLDSAIFTFDRTSLSYKLQTPYTFDIFHNLYNYMGQINEFPVLSLMNVKYLVTREDLENVDKRQFDEIMTARNPIYDQASQQFCLNQVQLGFVSCIVPKSLIDQEQNELRNLYFNIIIHTDTAANITFQLQNHGTVLAEWTDKGNIEYTTQKNIARELYLPIDTIVPQNKDSGNFEPQIFIKAHPLVSRKQPSVTVESVRLIPYTKLNLDEKTLVFKKGKLAVYAIKNNNVQTTITTLSQVKEKSTFRDFFNQVVEDSNQIAHTGYIISGQNTNKQINRFINSTNQTSVNSKKISSTRYLLQLNSQKSTILAFNQTFNPQWKVVPLKDPNDLNYSFFKDLKLINVEYLPEENHIIGNGYANFWLLPKGEKFYGVIFLPQVYSDIAGYISVCTLIFILLYFISIAIKKMNKLA